MNSLSTAVGLQLRWIQPSILARHFELHLENNLIGELRFDTAATAYGTLTTADSVTKKWSFKEVGLFKRRLTIRESEAKEDLAVFRGNLWGEGWVEFSNGNTFHWKSTNFRRTQWGLFNAHEVCLLVLTPKPSYPLQVQSFVEISAQGSDLDELPLLVMMGWYLRVKSIYSGW